MMLQNRDFWTSTLKFDFHEAIARLFAETQVPCQPRSYEDDSSSSNLPAKGFILSFSHELQIASTLAFLAHNEEDPEKVSAVTIQERSGRLVILVASNKTPSGAVIRHLSRIMATVSQYVVSGTI
jgi:hypothetical protein